MQKDLFSLDNYLSQGVERLVLNAVAATIAHPRQSFFFIRFARTSKRAEKIRRGFAAQGEHIPPFLIASIAENCNLHCAGCYARANKLCTDRAPADEMPAKRWKTIFQESARLGVAFILLAGGEPFLRPEVLDAAAKVKDVIFPVFTNGTLVDDKSLKLLTRHPHLIPVLSIEGDRFETDLRRGKGTYDKLMAAMDRFHRADLLYGASITVTKRNLKAVTDDDYVMRLGAAGCRLVIYVEYVPVTPETIGQAPDDGDRAFLAERLEKLRSRVSNVIFLAFPGDEKIADGCLAAGRGFFHINANGAAEPCPFSPHSDTNLMNVTVREALRSPLFQKIRNSTSLSKEHVGGCVLFEQDDQVKALLEAGKS